MDIYEFQTKVGPHGEIFIPDDLRKKIPKDQILSVTIQYKEDKTKQTKNSTNLKEMWEKYNFEGIWNGE